MALGTVEAVFFAQGAGEVGTKSGVEMMAGDGAWLACWTAFHPLSLARGADEFNRRMGLLLLDMCREPAGLPAEALAGAWFATFWASLGRGSVSTSLAEAGAFEASASHLRQSSAVEFVSMSTIEGLQAGAVSLVVASICTQQLDGVNKTELLVQSGTHILLAEAIKAYELRGPSKKEDTNIALMSFLSYGLAGLDMTAPEGQPIVQLLGTMSSALQFSERSSQSLSSVLSNPSTVVTAVAGSVGQPIGAYTRHPTDHGNVLLRSLRCCFWQG